MTVLLAVSDPFERLKALGRVYVDFAHENPGMYDLMFTARAPMDYLEKIRQNEWNEGRRAYDFLAGTVAECMEQGRFAGHDPGSLSYMLWSCVHGMVALENSNRCRGISGEDPGAIFGGAFRSFIRVLETI